MRPTGRLVARAVSLALVLPFSILTFADGAGERLPHLQRLSLTAAFAADSASCFTHDVRAGLEPGQALHAVASQPVQGARRQLACDMSKIAWPAAQCTLPCGEAQTCSYSGPIPASNSQYCCMCVRENASWKSRLCPATAASTPDGNTSFDAVLYLDQTFPTSPGMLNVTMAPNATKHVKIQIEGASADRNSNSYLYIEVRWRSQTNESATPPRAANGTTGVCTVLVLYADGHC